MDCAHSELAEKKPDCIGKEFLLTEDTSLEDILKLGRLVNVGIKPGLPEQRIGELCLALANYTGRVAGDDRHRRNIAAHNSTSPYNGTSADGNAWEHQCTHSKPGVVMNSDGGGFAGAGKGGAVGIVTGADQIALRRDAHVGTDADPASGIEAAVAIYNSVLANAEMEAANPAAAVDGSAWSDAVAKNSCEIGAPQPVGGKC